MKKIIKILAKMILIALIIVAIIALSVTVFIKVSPQFGAKVQAEKIDKNELPRGRAVGVSEQL